MLGSQCLLPDGYRPLVERLRLRILPLIVVEVGQVVVLRRDLGMLGSQCLLPDGYGSLVERLGFSIAGTIQQVECCLVEQPSRFLTLDGPLLDKVNAGERVGQEALAALPGAVL